MNRRGMSRFVEIERMLDKEKTKDEDFEGFDYMDFRDDLSYI